MSASVLTRLAGAAIIIRRRGAVKMPWLWPARCSTDLFAALAGRVMVRWVISLGDRLLAGRVFRLAIQRQYLRQFGFVQPVPATYFAAFNHAQRLIRGTSVAALIGRARPAFVEQCFRTEVILGDAVFVNIRTERLATGHARFTNALGWKSVAQFFVGQAFSGTSQPFIVSIEIQLFNGSHAVLQVIDFLRNIGFAFIVHDRLPPRCLLVWTG